ncbi:chemotaxis protein CheA [Halobacillus andaensis]|uniref:Chemotaxis protein CheA n=1 Tax=Halobacillus andaensis TaxID=1176239 RepID=A0A917AZD1_HALAA|nr:chemotaxis protein CheA [Halobacillus andaensis]MBP2003474.1 two-component system chemotaxis sensor kinase CheA [Halobacillus andaensis]GGF10898.1 chemotaxis protein CheA [Halobacillus andaensis]
METNQYLELFIDESNEHLQSINDRLLDLEKSPQELSIVGEIFRSAHTLKGMAATMGYQDLANLTHKMENVLDGVRNEKIYVDSEMLDVVFDSVDDLEAMVVDISQGGSGERDVTKVVDLLQAIELGEALDNRKKKQATPSAEASVELQVDEFTRTVLEQSQEQGLLNYKIKVSLRKDCMLKAARVYMVFEVLEQMGEVVLSTPAVEALENEEFDTDFQVLYVTDAAQNEIDSKVMNVSEIEAVQISEYQESDEVNKEVNFIPEDQENSNESSEKETTSPAKQAANKTIRVNIDRLDILMNLFEELVIDRGRLEQISNELHHSELQETVERMSRVSGDLQNIILNMRMVPIEQVFNRFPRMVRQLSRDLHKNIDLQIVGQDTELDRTVIDEIGDPLVHLIRNAIDHGIENPKERQANGKPIVGSIELKAYHSGNHVFIDISDDGAGINREKVLQKALSQQVVTQEQAEKLSDQEVYELIMSSGFSTADTISDVSGRGVGLDVVKNTIESLGGNITINSQLGSGSIFSIQLPLTLSIISVMLVEVQNEKYAVPLSSIIETAIVKKEDILRAHNKEVIDFRGSIVPLVSLKDVLDVPEVLEEDDNYSVVIVRKGNKLAGLVVDSFIGQQEVVLKSLGDYLSGVFAISGATILGDGQVALILDSNALIK